MENELPFDKIMKALKRDPDAKNMVIQYYLPKVTDIAKLYEGQGLPAEDLIGEGSLALVEGVMRFAQAESAEEAENTLFRDIMQAMERAINENLEELDKDERLLEKVNTVAERARELSADYGRKVSVAELSAESGLSERAIRDAIRLSGAQIEDIDQLL